MDVTLFGKVVIPTDDANPTVSLAPEANNNDADRLLVKANARLSLQTSSETSPSSGLTESDLTLFDRSDLLIELPPVGQASSTIYRFYSSVSERIPEQNVDSRGRKAFRRAMRMEHASRIFRKNLPAWARLRVCVGPVSACRVYCNSSYKGTYQIPYYLRLGEVPHGPEPWHRCAVADRCPGRPN